MQKRTVEKIVQGKMSQWLETITDEKLKKKVKDNLLVSGGCIASLFLNEKVNDFDVYIQDVEVLKELAAYYIKGVEGIQLFDGRYKDKLLEGRNEDGIGYFYSAVRTLKENQIKLFFANKSGGISFRETQNSIDQYIQDDERIDNNIPVQETERKKEYKPIFFSPNAISLSDDVQIVLRFWGNAEKIHETFDYVHATNYFTFNEGLVTNIQALECLLGKQLRYQGSHYPITSIIRMKKFIKRGWNISAGEMLKIMMHISKLDLSDVDVLEEQLIGVDVAYFGTLIDALRGIKDTGENIDQSYIFEIINRIFNGESTETENNGE